MKQRSSQKTGTTIFDHKEVLNTTSKRLAFEVSAAVLTGLYDLTMFMFEATTPGVGLGRLSRMALDLSQADLREQQVRSALYNLISRKMIARQEEGFVLTAKGRKQAQYYLIRELRIPPQPNKWDSQWRVVIFDIPEEFRFLRRILRTKLKQLGFLRLQQSVWIYPHPCEIVLQELIDRLNLNRYVALLTATSLPDTDKWRTRFQLKR